MKQQLIAITAAGALALGGIAAYAGQHGGEHGERGMGHWGNPLEHMTKTLDLTAQQQAQVAPIINAAKPQIKAIHEEAMQKTKVVMDNAEAQIRPLLTPEQQQKLDALKKAHEDMRKAMREMHEAQQK